MPDDLPRISVLTPCLNAASTLPAMLASVRAQDQPGVEHIVVDGGSTDGSVELLQEAEGVQWISERDDGMAQALNRGTAMASGEILGWLNADDTYEPGALRAVAEAWARRPATEWATGRCRIVDGRGREIRRPVTAYKELLLRHWSFPLFLTQNFVSCPATFVSRAALLEVGGFDERDRISVDYDLFLRLARRGPPLVVDQTLASFSMAEGSLGMSGFDVQFREHAEQAVRHGAGHPLAVAANQVISRAIVLAYRALRLRRRLLANR
jgi:glycosyltransferase involved in cell wall biosynthesis